MNPYQASLPRVAIMIAAVAMTALTLGLSVLPATLGSGGQEARVQPGSRGIDPVASDVTRDLAPIVVFGVREQKTAFEPIGANRIPRENDG